MLDREFDAGALAGLRDAVLAYATDCGMSRDRAVDVMLTIHELAANAVRHGAGHGRLRMRVTASDLCCEVSDPGPSSDNDFAQPAGIARRIPGTLPWPVRQGHGLWIAGTAADRISVSSGRQGSLISVMFALPGGAAG